MRPQHSLVAVAGLTSSVTAACNSTIPGHNATAEACSYRALVSAGLESILLSPNQTAYEQSVDSYYSDVNKIRPWYIVQPTTAEHVSVAVKALNSCPNTAFAVRGGGHITMAGANNIQDGVTIDLSNMNSTVVKDKDAMIGSIGPGARWQDVYADLDADDLAAIGGRDGNVGVAGFLLGGGNSYYSARVGFACDNVVNYQIVLADGAITDANATSNPDLFHALKGGMGNLGIVTRFDVQLVETKGIWGGAVVWPSLVSDDLVRAFTEFTTNAKDNTNAHFVGMWSWMQATGLATMGIVADMDGTPFPPAFNGLLGVVPNVPVLAPTRLASMAATLKLPPGDYATWFTQTYKNDVRVSLKATQLHADLVDYVKTLVPSGDFMTQCVLQPLPLVILEESAKRGGNILGVDTLTEDAVLLLLTVEVKTAELRETIYPKLKAMNDEIAAYAQSLGADLPFQYGNYADSSQDPLNSYGEANVKLLRDAAAKYDPNGVFQTKVPGGFKISKVA